MYNPDRVRQPLARGANGELEPIAWDDAIQRIVDRLGQVSTDEVRFITGNEAGSFGRLVDEWLRAVGAGPRVEQ